MAVVKKKGGNAQKKATKIMKPKQKQNAPDGLALPTESKGIDSDLSNYTILIYGREKIGKSTVFSGFPKALFFATEPGIKGLDIFSFNDENGGVTNWEIFRKGVDLLEEKTGQFKTIVIDTVDRAYDMALDWVCAERGIEYPGTDASGSEDYGRSWKAVKQEFTEQIHRLHQAGYGVGFISHAKEIEIKSRSGERYTRIFPSMAQQARTVIEALVDFFFYAEYVKSQKHSRILICEGDETIWAGARSAGGKDFPSILPMVGANTYGVITNAFKGLHVGLDVSEVFPSKATTKTVSDFIKKESARLKRPDKKGVQPKPKAVRRKT